MRVLPTPIGFNYRMTYIVKGGRTPRTALLRGSDGAGLRHIEPDEADVAYRIIWPSYDALPLMRPRTKVSAHWGSVRNANTFELLSYDGSIWWPHINSICDVTQHHLDSEDVIRMLEDTVYLFDAPGEYGDDDCERLDKIPDAREVLKNNFDEKLAQAQRKTYQDFLICGSNGYIRGGVPVYFRNTHGNKSVWEIDVASTGIDRHGDPRSVGLYDPPGNFLEFHAEQAFGSGQFWLAENECSAIFNSHRKQSQHPKIEIVRPGPIVDVDQVRLDALFREIVRMFQEPFRSYWRSQPVQSFDAELKRLCNPDLPTLSGDRLALLRSLMAKIDEAYYWEIKRIREGFDAFDDSLKRGPTWPNELTTEDDDAIASLAT